MRQDFRCECLLGHSIEAICAQPIPSLVGKVPEMLSEWSGITQLSLPGQRAAPGGGTRGSFQLLGACSVSVLETGVHILMEEREAACRDGQGVLVAGEG